MFYLEIRTTKVISGRLNRALINAVFAEFELRSHSAVIMLNN